MATDAYLGEHEGTDDVDAEHVQHHARPHGRQSRQVRRPSVVEEASQAVRGCYRLKHRKTHLNHYRCNREEIFSPP